MKIYQQFILIEEEFSAQEEELRKKLRSSSTYRWHKMVNFLKVRKFEIICNGEKTIGGIPSDVLVGFKNKNMDVKGVFYRFAKTLGFPFKSGYWYYLS
jgi:hypothetical protein